MCIITTFIYLSICDIDMLVNMWLIMICIICHYRHHSAFFFFFFNGEERQTCSTFLFALFCNVGHVNQTGTMWTNSHRMWMMHSNWATFTTTPPKQSPYSPTCANSAVAGHCTSSPNCVFNAYLQQIDTQCRHSFVIYSPILNVNM